MNAEFKMLKTSIKNLLQKIEGLSVSQLNEVPQGFSNNIIWNVGHLMVVQKLLLYGLSNNEVGIDDGIITHYKKGAKPQYQISGNEVEYLKSELIKFVPQLKLDVENNIFKSYTTYLTSYNFEITNFNEALVMVNLHYGLHFSTILKMLKLV